MGAYCSEVRKLEKNFQGLEIHDVLQKSNIATDILTKLGSYRTKVPPDIFVQELRAPSIKQLEEAPTDKILDIEPEGANTLQVLIMTIS